jgi:hypothetical protein
MLRWIDRNPVLSRFLRDISSALAARIGVPMLVGTIMIVLSGLCFAVVLPGLALADEISGALVWLCLPLGILHIGLFLGFLGFMLAAPLGADYRSE